MDDPAVRMTEDDLLSAIGDALTITGRRWMHVRRSDRALSMGAPGFPDVLAVVGDRLIAWELKAAYGAMTADQGAWLRALSGVRRIDARLIRPDDLDACLDGIVRSRRDPT